MVLGKKSLICTALVVLASVLAVFALANAATGELKLRSDEQLGNILVDGAGNTLYLFVTDAQGESACYEACVENWPPLLKAGDFSLGDGLSPELVGSVTRTDGADQVTYGGWPLYTFAGDHEPGATNGQGLNEVWYVVAADGTPVGMSPPVGSEAEGASATVSEDELLASLMSEGATVFGNICAACHGANGSESLVEHAAILADNSKLKDDRRLLRRVIHGGGYMPQFGNVLSDREVAAVLTYIRNSWGNDYGLIREEAATAAR